MTQVAGQVDYQTFLDRKSQSGGDHGFEPVWMPDGLFPFQESLVQWATRKGRAAIFADCGLGKTFMQLVWAENVARKTSRRVLVLTPLAVARQTVAEGGKLGVEVINRREYIERSDRLVVTNYERLHHFNPDDFCGCVCDESSILKHFTGATQKAVTRFMCKMPYRLLCTATAAPNDYTELGTSSEAIGELPYSEMLSRFFKYLDDKAKRREAVIEHRREIEAKHFARLAFRVHQTIGQWRLKHHAEEPFWRWVCSWARVCRRPSDLGFQDDGFILPELREVRHVITPQSPPDGMLFNLPAFGLKEERQERRRTLKERCDLVASLVDHSRPAVVWCHMNIEGDQLEKAIPGSRQIKGATPDDVKEAIYADFASGGLRVLIIKPKIGAWGLNWQHCSDVVTFASHSYEQYYQSIRRCWRFGQKRPVTVHAVTTEGEKHVWDNMVNKAMKADRMFDALKENMNRYERADRAQNHNTLQELPPWLSSIN